MISHLNLIMKIIIFSTVSPSYFYKYFCSTIRFRGKSATIAVVVAFSLGNLIAAIPLLPTLSWNFYGRSGVCIPLPITREEFPGKTYSSAVLIVLNFIMFVLIAVGQLFIYQSIRANTLAVSDKNSASQVGFNRYHYFLEKKSLNHHNISWR